MLAEFPCGQFCCYILSLLPLEVTPNPEVMQLQGVIQDLENQIEEHKSKILNTANAVLKVRAKPVMDIAVVTEHVHIRSCKRLFSLSGPFDLFPFLILCSWQARFETFLTELETRRAAKIEEVKKCWNLSRQFSYFIVHKIPFAVKSADRVKVLQGLTTFFLDVIFLIEK